MQIDWLTVAAQIVNFLVLVWLLQRFLYRPIMRAMQRREQRIAARLNDAEERKRQAEEEAQRYRDQQAELAREQEQLLEDARAEAAAERKTLEREAREGVEAQKREWLERLRAEEDSFLDDLRRRSAQEFFLLARQALAHLADADLEAQMAGAFLRELEDLDDARKRRVAEAFAESDGPLRLRSRFDLSPEAKGRITKALRRWLGREAEVDYVSDAELLCGLELQVGSQSLRWSLDSYLDGLEGAVRSRLASLVGADEAEEAAG